MQTPQDTAAFAARLVPPPPCRVYLSGALGAGKTFFVRALLAALGEDGRVRSPSYGLAISYRPGALTVHHLDCYRLQGAPLGDDLQELLDDEDALCLLEWPENSSALPLPDLHLHFTIGAGDTRDIRAGAASKRGQAMLARLQ